MYTSTREANVVPIDMSDDERNSETGQFATRFPPETFIDSLRDIGDGVTTREVSDSVGCPPRTAHVRLSALEEDERVVSRTVGSVELWSLPATDR